MKIAEESFSACGKRLIKIILYKEEKINKIDIVTYKIMLSGLPRMDSGSKKREEIEELEKERKKKRTIQNKTNKQKLRKKEP